MLKAEAGFCSLPLFLYLCCMKEKGINYILHKFVLFILKVIPMLLAEIALLNTALSYWDIDVPLLSYLGGISLFPLIFLYLASYAFKFCKCHRMFLHYVSVTWVMNIYDYYIGIPISNKELIMVALIIFCIFFFLVLYCHQQHKKGKCLHGNHCIFHPF